MSEYTPDRWEIVKIDHPSETIHKVIGGWCGGYLDGDSWRMSSGIDPAQPLILEDDYYIIKNYSGSVYRCHKDRRGTTGMSAGVLSNLIKQGEEQNIPVTVDQTFIDERLTKL